MSLRLLKLKCLVYVIVVTCLVGLVLHYLKDSSPVFNRKIITEADNRKLVSEALTLNHTQRQTTAHKKDITNSFNISSPFINPVFHVNISSSLPSGNNVDHIILFWESPGWFHQWSHSSNISQCVKYTNCKQTFDRSLFNKSKAVVFNLPENEVGQTPPLRLNSDQAWVFFTLESPLHINPIYNSYKWHNVFNWSWTYHPSADIFHPYGVSVEKKITPYKDYSNTFRKKTKFAAWVVSNCHAPSRRNDYVKILKQFVDVDVFGSCGKPAPLNLEKFLSQNYKFYLSFENSLCENYMTEKFFHYYQLDVITVLRGHNNYKEYLPNGSFIDTANFSSISALAKFMKDLGGNEDKYVSYLKMKDRYTVYEREFLFKDSLCKLCEKVNNIESNRKTYTDIYKWLGPCFDAKDLIVNSSRTLDITG